MRNRKTHERDIMNNNANIILLLLAVTAGLLAFMAFNSWQVEKAYGETVRASSGDYIVVTGKRAESVDLLYVIDVAHKKLLVYDTDEVRLTTTIVDDRINLETVFGKKRR